MSAGRQQEPAEQTGQEEAFSCESIDPNAIVLDYQYSEEELAAEREWQAQFVQWLASQQGQVPPEALDAVVRFMTSLINAVSDLEWVSQLAGGVQGEPIAVDLLAAMCGDEKAELLGSLFGAVVGEMAVDIINCLAQQRLTGSKSLVYSVKAVGRRHDPATPYQAVENHAQHQQPQPSTQKKPVPVASPEPEWVSPEVEREVQAVEEHEPLPGLSPKPRQPRKTKPKQERRLSVRNVLTEIRSELQKRRRFEQEQAEQPVDVEPAAEPTEADWQENPPPVQQTETEAKKPIRPDVLRQLQDDFERAGLPPDKWQEYLRRSQAPAAQQQEPEQEQETEDLVQDPQTGVWERASQTTDNLVQNPETGIWEEPERELQRPPGTVNEVIHDLVTSLQPEALSQLQTEFEQTGLQPQQWQEFVQRKLDVGGQAAQTQQTQEPPEDRIYFHIEDAVNNAADLDDAAKQRFAEDARTVISRMPPGAVARLTANMKSMRLVTHEQLEEVFMSRGPNYKAYMEDAKRRGKQINGAYAPEGIIYETHDHANGHELTHAIDGPDRAISSTPEWQQAWQADIVNTGQLTNYATRNPQEGFAEFGRMLFSNPSKQNWVSRILSNVDRSTIERLYPNCVAVWKAHGIWE